MPTRLGRCLTWAEWLLAIVVVILAVWLRVEFVRHAGGLWRDEAGSVGLATLPTLGEVWGHLEHESFPIVWPLVLRGCCALTGGGDFALRMLGLTISIGAIAAVCALGWRIHGRAPLVALTLLGLNVTLVQWGSTTRGHGAGVLTGLLAIAAYWRLALNPNWRTAALAAAAAALAVHTLFYNTVIVLAAAAGLTAVAALRREWRAIWLGGAAGAVSAASLAVYAGVFRRGADWKPIVEIASFDLPLFLAQAAKVLVGMRASILWLALMGLAVAWGCVVLARGPNDRAPSRSESIAFALVTLSVAIVGYFGFLKFLRYPTQVWYYLALLAPVAFCLDVALSRLAQGTIARLLLLAVILGSVRLLFPFARAAVPLRLTNMDLIAADIASKATERDLVVVNPWFLGVSYSRYHAPAAEWLTVPPLRVSSIHRYDMVKAEMLEPDQKEPTRVVRERIQATLTAGGRVYLIGAWPPAEDPADLPPAPNAPSRWAGEPYFKLWYREVATAVARHAQLTEVIPLRADAPTSVYENPALVVAAGWRE